MARLIIQFWVPVRNDNNEEQLSNAGQPFAVSKLHQGFEGYRNRDMPPTYAYRTGMSELLLGATVEPFGIEASYMVPIWRPSENSSSCCVGVIECSVVCMAMGLEFVNTMNRALEVYIYVL